jgi:hypothetical protein
MNLDKCLDILIGPAVKAKMAAMTEAQELRIMARFERSNRSPFHLAHAVRAELGGSLNANYETFVAWVRIKERDGDRHVGVRPTTIPLDDGVLDGLDCTQIDFPALTQAILTGEDIDYVCDRRDCQRRQAA